MNHWSNIIRVILHLFSRTIVWRSRFFRRTTKCSRAWHVYRLLSDFIIMIASNDMRWLIWFLYQSLITAHVKRWTRLSIMAHVRSEEVKKVTPIGNYPDFFRLGDINERPGASLVQVLMWFLYPVENFKSPQILPLHNSDICFQNVICFPMLFAIFLYDIGPVKLIFYQHCGCWWPGALAPGHQ